MLLNTGYDLLNFSCRLFKNFSYSFTDFQDEILMNCSCSKRMENISCGYNKNHLHLYFS